MGAQRLHPDVRRLPPLGWAHCRSVRAPSCLFDRPHGVHPREPSRRSRTEPGDADRCEGRSGARRCNPVSRNVDDPDDDVQGAEGSCPRDGHLERGSRGRRRGRRSSRRRPHRGAFLALDPVHQHPHRCRHLHRRAGVPAREPRPGRAPAARRARCRARHRGPDLARVRRRPHYERRLGLLADPGRLRAWRSTDRLVRRPRGSCGHGPAHAARAVPAAVHMDRTW